MIRLRESGERRALFFPTRKREFAVKKNWAHFTCKEFFRQLSCKELREHRECHRDMRNALRACRFSKVQIKEWVYRVTHHVVKNLPLISKQKFRFGLSLSGQARPKQNFCFDDNRRYGSI